MTQVSLLDDADEYEPPRALVEFLAGFLARGRKLKDPERRILEGIARDALRRTESALRVSRRTSTLPPVNPSEAIGAPLPSPPDPATSPSPSAGGAPYDPGESAP